MSAPSLRELRDVAAEAAYQAGRRTLAYFNVSLDVEHKADATPVTVADREAETVIRQLLQRYFPTHTLLGEEHGRTEGDPDYVWVVDPIDGTKSFIHGVPLYGTVVGCLVKGEPQVGAVYLPPLGDLFVAAEGLGATWNGRPCRVSDVSRLDDATLLASSITRALARSDAYATLEKQVKLNRGWGDAFGYMLVASGRAEIMLDPTISLWDIAGVAPIVREAGGFLGNWKGEATVHGPDSVATNAWLRETVLHVLRNEKRHAPT
ncbi:MAG: inositol monophosphatase family protein [Tepidisphaerales bacterium]